MFNFHFDSVNFYRTSVGGECRRPDMSKRSKLRAAEWARPAAQVKEARLLMDELQKHTSEQRSLINLSSLHQDMNLRQLASTMAGSDNDRASAMLLHAAESFKEERVSRTQGPMFCRWGGPVDSIGNPNCPFDSIDLEDARDVLVPLFDENEDDFWRKTPSPHLSGGADIVWGTTERCFNHDACESLMGRGPMCERDKDRFERVGGFHRKFSLMLRRTMCADSLRVSHVSILKQSEESGCLDKHLDPDTRLQCCILLLAIYDYIQHEWLEYNSPEVAGGVDVFDYYSGERDDHGAAFPVRCPFNHVGDCMILRGAHFANKTVKPPPGFEVYKYVI